MVHTYVREAFGKCVEAFCGSMNDAHRAFVCGCGDSMFRTGVCGGLVDCSFDVLMSGDEFISMFVEYMVEHYVSCGGLRGVRCMVGLVVDGMSGCRLRMRGVLHHLFEGESGTGTGRLCSRCGVQRVYGMVGCPRCVSYVQELVSSSSVHLTEDGAFLTLPQTTVDTLLLRQVVDVSMSVFGEVRRKICEKRDRGVVGAGGWGLSVEDDLCGMCREVPIWNTMLTAMITLYPWRIGVDYEAFFGREEFARISNGSVSVRPLDVSYLWDRFRSVERGSAYVGNLRPATDREEMAAMYRDMDRFRDEMERLGERGDAERREYVRDETTALSVMGGDMRLVQYRLVR